MRNHEALLSLLLVSGDNLYFANQDFGNWGLCQDQEYMNNFIPSSAAVYCYGIVGDMYYLNPKETGYTQAPDIAILKVADTAEKSLLNLTSSTSIADSIVQGQSYNAYGWSKSSDDVTTSGHLRTATSELASPSTAAQPYFTVNNPDITYPSDSGSPLINAGTGSYDVLGILSIYGGYYVDLTKPKIKSWVQQVLDGQIMPSCQPGSRCNDYTQVTGSYSESCIEISYDSVNYILSAECSNSGGYLVSTSLNYFDQCYTGVHATGYNGNSTVSDINGTLTCDVNANVPQGPYMQTCTLYKWDGTILGVTCKNNEGVEVDNQFDTTFCHGNPLWNSGGHLSCLNP